MAAFFPTPASSVAERFGGFALALALHVLALFLLLQFDPVRRSLLEAAPIMVNFIAPPTPVEAPPAPRPAPPRPVLRPLPTPPLLTTQAVDSPSPIQAPPPAPVPAPVEAPAPAPAPVVPPSFSAAYLHNPAPAYPAISRRLGEEGRVLLRVLVSAEGGAERVEVQSSSNSIRLDQAAADAVRNWRFVPAQQAGRPVAGWAIVPIRFSLEG